MSTPSLFANGFPRVAENFIWQRSRIVWNGGAIVGCEIGIAGSADVLEINDVLFEGNGRDLDMDYVAELKATNNTFR